MSIIEGIRQWLFKPCDPSLLAFFRMCFGFFMMMDVIQERGMSRADSIFVSNSLNYCSFPLFQGMKPFGLEVMLCLYAVMFLNAFLVAIGYLYRINIISYTIIYWYFFILDTSTWNNHSYLYGLIGLLFSVTNAHHYMSVDGFLFPDKRNADVPHWNYLLFKCQVFIVYFYAGLKKTEADWMTGFSMNKLSKQWVFDPLRPILSNDNIDFWIVHICGFIFDISVGFLLIFRKTRILGLILCLSFHGLNSMIFSIGMFPYVMMASSFIFCSPRSFKVLLSKIFCSKVLFRNDASQRSGNCLYSENIKNNMVPRKWKLSQILVACLAAFYISCQAFLPYSHFITKGYNGWTKGLYGYSWDMMVHSFANQHVKIMYKNLDDGDVGYLKPDAFLANKRTRWTTQPAMAYQYAVCIKKQLKRLGLNNSAVYFDVWKSLNRRFQQRIFDPHTDIAGYEWSPIEAPSFVLPLMADLTEWRLQFKTIKRNLRKSSSMRHIVFVADFPGLYLDNYVSEDLENSTIHVLKGKVEVSTEHNKTILSTGENCEVPTGKFHRVQTVSEGPSCYYYFYVNKTVKSLKKQLNEYKLWIQRRSDKLDYGANNDDDDDDDSFLEFSQETIDMYNKEQRLRNSRLIKRNWEHISKFIKRKLALAQRSFLLLWLVLQSYTTGKPLYRHGSATEGRHPESWEKRWQLGDRDPFKKSEDKVEL